MRDNPIISFLEFEAYHAERSGRLMMQNYLLLTINLILRSIYYEIARV